MVNRHPSKTAHIYISFLRSQLSHHSEIYIGKHQLLNRPISLHSKCKIISKHNILIINKSIDTIGWDRCTDSRIRHLALGEGNHTYFLMLLISSSNLLILSFCCCNFSLKFFNCSASCFLA